MSYIRSLDDVKTSLQKEAEEKRPCVLLVGGGCSVKAGMPDAAGFARILNQKFPGAAEKAGPEEFHRLASRYAANARLNWAHIGMALLMQKGYAGRILATNFDNLPVRACALLGEFPAVYDPTPADVFKIDPAAEKAIVYLRGQTPLFAVFQEQEKPLSYWESLNACLRELALRHTWIVAGYGGQNDAVFDLLKKIERFDHGLYWTSLNNVPPAHVRQELLGKNKGAFYVPGHDADSFFVTLAQTLGIFPPELITRPFTRMEEILRELASYPLPGDDGIDVANVLRIQMQVAIRQFEPPKDAGAEPRGLKETVAKAMEAPELLAAIADAQNALMAGDYERALANRKQFDKTPSPQLGQILSWSHILAGRKMADAARDPREDGGLELHRKAIEQYQAALAIDAKIPDAFLHWGQTLLAMAKFASETGEVEDLLRQAGDKFEKAVKLRPPMADALLGWGSVLLQLGKNQEKTKAFALFSQAIEKFQAALNSRAETLEAYAGWGEALSSYGEKTRGDEAALVFERAVEIYHDALQIAPNDPVLLYRKAMAWSGAAKNMSGNEAETLYIQAEESFRDAVQADPGKTGPYCGWGFALLEQSKNHSGRQADALLDKALEKFQAAAARAGEKTLPEALRGWGSVLALRAEKETGKGKAESLDREAAEKLEESLRLQPGRREAVSLLGAVLLRLYHNSNSKGPEAESLLSQALDKFQDAAALDPSDGKVVAQAGRALVLLAGLKGDAEAEALLDRAEEKFRGAAAIDPAAHEALHGWGNLLAERARRRPGPEGESLFNQALEKYKAALEIKPEYPEALALWGQVLAKEAGTKSGAEAETLYLEATRKFESARGLGAVSPETLDCWGYSLIRIARTKRGINAHPLLAEAKKKLQEAEDLRPGVSAYNMALLMAELSNESACREWLARCKEYGVLPGKQSLLDNPELESVRDSKWFKALLAEVFQTEKSDPVS